MSWLGGVVIAAALGAAPVAREAAPAVEKAPVQAVQSDARSDAQVEEALAAAMSYPSSVCKKKRVDSCGCHHVYGVRHCHPDRKGKHCEALVRAELPWSHAEPLTFKL